MANNKEIKGCIFDLDGVIVDTAKYHYLAWKKLADELGIDFDEKDNEELKGVSRKDSLKIILALGSVTLSEEAFEEKMSQKNEEFKAYIQKMTSAEILPGVKNFLDELQSHNIRIALGSASKNAENILNQIGMSQYFEVRMDGTNIHKAKPDPEVFVKAAENLGLKPENCLVFEDAVKGVEAAHRGGMRVIGIGDSQTLAQAELVYPGFDKLHWKDLKNTLVNLDKTSK